MANLLPLLVRLMAALLILTATGTVVAQDNNLPAREPLLTGVRIPPDRMAWSTDGVTLWFEAQIAAEDYRMQAFEYIANTGELRELDESPFSFIPTGEEQNQYYIYDRVFRSPYDSDDVIFTTSIHPFCGWNECSTGFAMAGSNWRNLDLLGSDLVSLRILDIPHWNTGGVTWSRDGNAAVILNEFGYGEGFDLFRIQLDGRYEEVYIDGISSTSNQVMAMSDNGTQVLYNSGFDPEALMLWEGDFFKTARTSLVSTNIQKLVTGNIAGASFTDRPGEIVYIGEEGIMSYSLSSGYTRLLEAWLKSTWMNYALFSPKNRYIAALSGKAISYEGDLYVMTTGLGF